MVPPLFAHTARAALALTECATLIAEDGVPQPVWDQAIEVLGEKGVAQVLMAVVAINSWNRLAVSTHQDLPAEQ